MKDFESVKGDVQAKKNDKTKSPSPQKQLNSQDSLGVKSLLKFCTGARKIT